MDYKIEKLILRPELYSEYNFVNEEQKVLNNISKVNILVGTNNSGKSRFMRKLIIDEEFNFTPHNISLEKLNSLINQLKQDVQQIMDNLRIVDYGHTNQQVQALKTSEALENDSSFFKDLDTAISSLLNLPNISDQSPVHRGSIGNFFQQQHKQIKDNLSVIGQKAKEEFNYIVEGKINNLKLSFSKVYIPTLRGLRPLEDDRDSYYFRTHGDYFNAMENKFSIFTGLNLYQEVKDLLLGNLADRETIAEFQNYLSETFFQGQSVTLIPNRDSDVLNVKIGDEKEKKIYDLGDGIQSIIILTFPLFINKGKNLLVFIEEPELYLHPGLQRKLLETFMEFPNYQFFITTHSNHLLDMSLDFEKISIFTFNKELSEGIEKEKDASFIVENVSNEDNGVLEILGVKNSSVFLSNCTIWVEGITDRFYIRRYLKIYMEAQGEKEYKEDQHFSFVEYGGNNITHWSFLDDGTEAEGFGKINVDRLCSKLFLITDKDKGKEQRHEKLSEKLGDRYYCLQCLEIENLIKKEVLLEVIAEYENVKAENLKFTKSDFNEDDYKDISLGEFIDKNLKERKRKRYGEDSGTIVSKDKFCKKVISHVSSICDLSDEAKELCSKLLAFIKENN